ncbi:hypothetical protein WJX77_003186 [Trebouxia sp. C0004]
MAFNGGAPFGQPGQPALGQPFQQPFGQPGQPAFGQPSQQPQPSNVFGASNGSASPQNGKITFGARAAAKQPTAASDAPAQPAGGFQAAAGFGQHSFGSPNSNAFGESSSTLTSAPFTGGTAASPSPVPGTGVVFGGMQQASFTQSRAAFGADPRLATGGFGSGKALEGPFAGGQQSSNTPSSAPFASGLDTAGFGAAGGNFGAVQSTQGAFGGSLQAGQGFGAFGGTGASNASAASTKAKGQSPFARLGGRDPQPSNHDQLASNGTQPKPLNMIAQPAQTPATGSANQKLPAAGGFGSQHSAPAFGLGASPAFGTNPLGAPADTSTIKPADFGRAAKRQQPEPAQQQDQQQQQPQADAQMQPRLAALRPQHSRQKPKTPQTGVSTELADPAALAARSARFGQAQQQQSPRPFGQSQQSPGVFSRLSGTSVQTCPPGNQQEQADGNKSQQDADGSEQDVEQPDRQMGSSSRAMPVTAAEPIAHSLENGAAPTDEMEPNVSVEGFCTGMCPDYQLRSRTQHANENSLEVVDPLGKGRTIDQLATKKFERNVNMEENAALPNMFRTLPALKATERHLMDYLDSDDPLLGLGRVSMYLWDRQRSIRQDMAWQRMEGVDVMNMYEEHAVTAIYMDAEMSHHGDPGSGDNTESYHPGLVIEQLNKTLISLTAMYETALLQGQPAPNAAEFNTYAFIMLLVGTRQKDALAAFFQRHILPYNPSPYVALALRLHRLVANDVNPWAFFKLVDKASYRLGLWLQFLFPKMRYLYLTRLVSAAGPKQNPETRPVAELTHAMWFDSEEETLSFLLKASLQPEQSSTGAWQLVLHRSQNVHDQAESAAADVQALIGGSTAMLQTRQSSLPAGSSQLPSLQQTQSQWPAVPQTPLASTSQMHPSPAFTWPDAQTPAPAPAFGGGGVSWGSPSNSQPAWQQLHASAADPSSVQKPPQDSQALQQQQQEQQLQVEHKRQEQQRLEQQQQEHEQQDHQRRQAERQRLEQERLQRQQQQQQQAQQLRAAEQRAQAERARHQQQQQQQQAEAQAQWQHRQAEEQRQQQEQQRQQQLQKQLQRQKQLQQAEAQEKKRLQQQQQHQREVALETKARRFHDGRVQRQALRLWRQLTVQRRAQYGQQVILSKLASSFSSLRPGPAASDQVVCRHLGNAAQRPLHGYLQSHGGSLQDALPLPALVAPALAAANAEQTYLRWKAVIHYMPSSSAAAAQGPDFAAAKWFRNQMAYKAGAAYVGNDEDTLLSVAFTDLLSSSVSQHKPVSGILTSVCDASRLATAQLNTDSAAEQLQHTMAGASVLILLLTRADSPAQTEACLESLLASSPPLSKVPLLVLTTSSDLYQGVQQWMTTLPGKLGEVWQRVGQLQTVCLAKAASSQTASKPGALSRAALREGLKWAAAHTPRQPSVRAMPLEQLLSKELEQQLEPLMSSPHLMPQAWISVFNQMLHQVWQQMNEAAATAEGVGGWPPPEMAAIDATLQQQWWTAPVLARFEGAISSLCLPGMSASLGASPQAVPMYVQHYLGISASGTSWQQTLAAAMHSRIRAVQLQSLPPAVVPARHSFPPLLPSVHPPCRLSSNPGLFTDAGLVTRSVNYSLNAQSALYNRGPTHLSEQRLGNGLPNPSRELESARHTASYADVLKANGTAKISKRKVAEAEHAFQEPQLPVKRHQNGFDQSLSSLQEQTKQLQQLIAESKAKK